MYNAVKHNKGHCFDNCDCNDQWQLTCNHNGASIVDPKPGRNCIWHVIWYKIMTSLKIITIIFHISVQEHLTLNSIIHNFNCQHSGHFTNKIASIIFYHSHVDASLRIPCLMTQYICIHLIVTKVTWNVKCLRIKKKHETYIYMHTYIYTIW